MDRSRRPAEHHVDYVYVRFSKQLVELLGDGWSAPVQCRLKEVNGVLDMHCRTVPNIIEAPAPLSDEDVARIRAAWEALPNPIRPVMVGEPET